MTDIIIRVEGKLGRITLNRPQALNALTYDMCMAIEQTLDQWADDDAVLMVLIDSAGDRAFCSGGDITDMYNSGLAKDYDYGRKFWADEYRMNAKIAAFPKPYAALMQGYTMGGGVGVSCHGSHRIVGQTSQISMPECGIGLVPDVGGSHLLSQAPGRLGEYLGATASRMTAGDAIYAGFADYFIPQENWPELTVQLIKTGDWTQIDAMAQTAPVGKLQALQPEIDAAFAGETLGDIFRTLTNSTSEFAADTLKKLGRNAPLSMACLVEMIHRLRISDDIRRALELEYRFTYRSMEHGDFIEGIRAAIIDKDRDPKWQHSEILAVNAMEVSNMLLPLKSKTLKL